MTITEKLNCRVERAERYRKDAFESFRDGSPDAARRVHLYWKAAKLVDLTAQKAIEERGR